MAYQWFSLSTVCVVAWLLSGCVSLQLPPQFVELPSGWHEFKAVTADDSVLWVREFKDPVEGDLDFWALALKNEFVNQRGYTLIEDQTRREDRGPARRDFLFEATVQGSPHRYLVSLFVKPSWGGTRIRTVEYVAPKKIFDSHLEGVKKSIATLR